MMYFSPPAGGRAILACASLSLLQAVRPYHLPLRLGSPGFPFGTNTSYFVPLGDMATQEWESRGLKHSILPDTASYVNNIPSASTGSQSVPSDPQILSCTVVNETRVSF